MSLGIVILYKMALHIIQLTKLCSIDEKSLDNMSLDKMALDTISIGIMSLGAD
jgi:hypothetical protein